jgi:hypothetical protein
MPLMAFSTPARPEWHWRITDASGTTVGESEIGFSTIAAAIAAGRRRLKTMPQPGPSELPKPARPLRFGRRGFDARRP